MTYFLYYSYLVITGFLAGQRLYDIITGACQ